MTWTFELNDEVIRNSIQDTFDEARKEWKVVSGYDLGECIENCLCGHEGIRYAFEIENVYNGRRLYPIGSSCISKFNSTDMKLESECIKQSLKLIDEAVKLGDISKVPFSAPYYSRKLINFLKEKEVVSEEEREFLVRMFNGRRMSRKQYRYLAWIVKSKIRPFMGELWKQGKR